MGAIDALDEGDALYASYRDHGTALAVGSPAAAVMAELFGKDTGVAHGRGGSMHLLDVERRFYGGWGIVGAHLPIAAGTALALVYRDQRRRPVPVRRRRRRHRRVSRGAQPGRGVGPPDRVPGDQQPVRHGHLGGPVERRARAVASGRGLPDARRAGGRKRRAGGARGGCPAPRQAREERHPALLETITYRYRGHSVADAGQGVPHARGGAVVARARPDHRYGLLLGERGIARAADLDVIWEDVAAR